MFRDKLKPVVGILHNLKNLAVPIAAHIHIMQSARAFQICILTTPIGMQKIFHHVIV